MAQEVSLQGSTRPLPGLRRQNLAHIHPEILLVEDDMEDVMFIERAFRQVLPVARLNVLHQGEEAIAYLLGEGRYAERGRYPMPDLILLDLQIPRKSGLEVLAWIWEQPKLKPIRVVVLTGSQKSADIQRVREFDACYQLKPASFSELTAFLEKICHRWLNPRSSDRRKMRRADPVKLKSAARSISRYSASVSRRTGSGNDATSM